MQSEWTEWLETAEFYATEVSATDEEGGFEIDDIQFRIKAGSDEQDQPWIFELVN